LNDCNTFDYCEFRQRRFVKLYKYRSISGDSFRFTQDIFIERRLFSQKAVSLNDPNEGVLHIEIENPYSEWGNQLEQRNRQQTHLCCFSSDHKNTLMWSHYADQHKGICIEFNSTEFIYNSGRILEVEYSDNIKKIPPSDMENYEILFSSKSSDWSYEKEWRYISKDNQFLKFSDKAISRILLGWRFDESNLDILRFWLKQINPLEEIPVVKMIFPTVEYKLYEEGEMQDKNARIRIV
jgi:Protein of unknown function (DUF2971)